MDYFLKQVEPGNPNPLLISLHEDVMKIGRSTIVSLSRYNRVSRYHASLTKRNDCWYLTDLGSLNCLYVNFNQVKDTVPLNIGDIIGFGSPNISQDGGFVCVLTARNKVVIVKQEPLDDDCVEIPIHAPAEKTGPGVSTSDENTTEFRIHNETDTLKFKPEVSGSTFATNTNICGPQICKVETIANKHPNIDDCPKLQSYQSIPFIEDPPSVVSMDVNLCQTDLSMSSETRKLVSVNPITTATHNINNIVSNTETTIYDSNIGGTNSETLGYNINPNHAPSRLNPTLCSQMSAYPGIEYLEEVNDVKMENESLEKQADSDTNTPGSDSIEVINLETESNSIFVKQEIYSDLASTSNVSKSNELKTAVVTGCEIAASQDNRIPSSCANNVTNINNLSRIVNRKNLSNVCIPNPINHSNLKIEPHDLMQLEKIPDLLRSLSSVSFCTPSLTENNRERNISVGSIGLNPFISTNIKQEKPLNFNENSPNVFVGPSAKDFGRKWPNSKDKLDYNYVESGQVICQQDQRLPEELIANSFGTEKTIKSSTTRVRECSIPLIRCDSTNLQVLLNTSEKSEIVSAKKEIALKEIHDAKKTIKIITNGKNIVSETHSKMEHLHNLKNIKHNKNVSCDLESILNDHSEKMIKNSDRETSTKASITVSKIPTEKFTNNVAQNLNQQNKTMTKTIKSFHSNGKEIDSSKANRITDSIVSLKVNSSKTETSKPHKELADAASDNQRLSHPVKRKKYANIKDGSKRIKTKETEENCFSLSSQSEIKNSPFIGSNKTVESNKMAKVSHVVCSKRRCSEENHPIRSPLLQEAVNEKTNGILYRGGSKSMGRTLLIDSKPMEYRPRTRRGREEWFQERSGEVSETKSTFATSTHTASSTQNDWNAKKSNTELLKHAKSVIKNVTNQNIISNLQKNKEKEATLKRHRKSEERTDPRKILATNSKPNLKIDTNVGQKPTVPRKRNSFSSRMGFLIDMPVKHKKPHLDDKQEVDTLLNNKIIRCSLPTQLDTMSSESKMKPNTSLKVVDPDKDSTYIAKRNFTQTSIGSKMDCPATTEQHSIRRNQKSNETEKIFKNCENGDRSLDMDYRLGYNTICEQRKEFIENRNISDKTSNLGKSKTIPNQSNQFKNVSTTNSKKVAVISPFHKTINEIPKCQSSSNESKWLNSSATVLVENIVGWNPKWLEEQTNNKSPPPLITKHVSYLNSSFSSYESYASSYFPMIGLEVWECLFRESRPFLVQERLQNWNNFCFTIKSWESRRRVTELKCESVVSDVLCYHPTEGKLVLINILGKEEDGIKNFIFGCIRHHSIEEFKRGAPEWENLPTDALFNAKLVKFQLFIKKIKRPMQLKSVYLAHGLLNIKDKMQLADALHSFRDSPLCKDIYHPREESFMFCDSSRKPLSKSNLIQAVSDEVRNPQSKTRVLFIHASPGTGKTQLVVDLVRNLISDNSTKTKILVCTPSYTTLDDILDRLIESGNICSNSSSTNYVKFVRLGEDERIESIDSKMKEYYLQGQVERLYREDCTKKMQRRESVLKLLEEKINDLLFKQCNAHGKYKKINKDSTLQALIKKMSSVKERNLLHPMDEGYRKGYECISLKESNVLLSTLESSIQPAARTFLKETNSAYCIVDDAMQCNELQLLQCLQHRQIAKLILLGDSKQMSPTIFSQFAAKYGFDRSTIERFCLHYRKRYHKVPCSSLKKQYRMHSEICLFPSRYFYNQTLQTASGIDERFARFPLKPYNVIDILDPGPISDETVSSLIVYICSILVQAAPNSTVGVIVDKCGLSMPHEYNKVEVNTLECLQGREKDVVLIPCIRPFAPSDDFLSCEKRMNVAITRAKQCLVICGRISSQVQFPHWRALLDDAMNRNCYLCVASIKHLPLVFSNFIKKVY